MTHILLILLIIISAGCGNELERPNSDDAKDRFKHGSLDDCKQLSLENQTQLGQPCINALVRFAPHPAIKKMSIPFISFTSLRDVTNYDPDLLGVNLKFNKGRFYGKTVFIKPFLHIGQLSKIVDRFDEWRDKGANRYFSNELYWAQKLAAEDLGPQLFGITVMEISLNDQTFPVFALIGKFIEGKTYKVFYGEWLPRHIEPEHRKPLETFIPRLRSFVEKNNLIPGDLQYMVDKNYRVWVIDTGAFSHH